MKKRIWSKAVSIFTAILLVVGIVPNTTITALAAVGAPSQLYVGNKQVISGSDNATYWTTDTDGNLTQSAADQSWNVKYDPATVTLTLRGATIQGGTNTGPAPFGSGIYAQCSIGQSVTLTIKLIGENTITGYYGIYVNAEISADSNGTDASLTITGENNGSLEVSGSNHGIFVKSGTGNASLNIEKATVTSSTNGGYAAGVNVQSSANATGSPNISLSVNGGSLTASGTGNSDGILFHVGQSQATGATTSLTITDHAIVDARNGGISASRISETLPTPTPTGENSSGIVFNGTEGTVYGNVTLDESLTIDQDETLTIPDGSSLNGNGKLTNNGTILVESGGTVTGETGGNGTVVSAPKITTESLSEGTVATAYNQTLQADNNPTKWSIADGFLPSGLTLNENTGEISGIPTTEGTSTFTAKAENSAGSDSKQYTLTIAPKPTVSVTGVKLDQTSLSLTVGGTGTLNATVQPDNATNKAVPWSSRKEPVATVEHGVISAVGAGTADITVTTQDGQKTAVCAVTVTQPQPPSPPSGNDDDDDDDPLYFTALPDTDHGSVSVSPRNAAKGSTVTVTARPDEGYTLKKLTVTDSRGKALDLTGQSDGTYTFTMPAGGVTVKAVFAPVQAEEPQPEPEDLPFADVPEDAWYADAVAYVYEQGLMTGTGDTTFAPDVTTSRSMIAAILWRQAGSPAANDAVDFSDVAQGQWYSEAVRWAASEGIVGGYGDGAFGTDDPITREQLAVMLYRFAQHQGYDVSVGEDTNILSYTDAQEISEYAVPALQWACGAGILQGDGAALSPQGQTTRAEAAAMLMRFCQTCGDG